MKRETLFEHKEVAITYGENMGNTNEYRKILKPPTKYEKNIEGRKIDVICG
jgi:hypothetical protein